MAFCANEGERSAGDVRQAQGKVAPDGSCNVGAPHHRTVCDDLTDDERRFVEMAWCEGRRLYRDLPWRSIDDPYAVLVSEVMLQQTQVSRVEKYWDRFLKLFPTIDALASAETSLVLESWQGLGYNRRALMLKRCAEICSHEHAGKLPATYGELLRLPGIGKATAGGICAFAYREPAVYLETNVRTVFIHELFADREAVSDKEIEPLVERTCSLDDPRGWYYALLDYGAHLKSITVNPSRRSRHHVVQSKFEGSRRQKRAELVRFMIANRSATFNELYEALVLFERIQGRPEPDLSLARSIVDDLVKEGFFSLEGEGDFAHYVV